MSLLNFNIRKVSQKGGAPCNNGLDFINHVECQTNVDITNGKLKIDGVNYTAYEIGGALFSSLPFEKYECKLTKENQLVNTGPIDTQKKFTRFMAVVKKNGSSIPQYTTIIKNHNQIKGEDIKKKDDEEIELFTLVIHAGSIIPSLTFKNIQEGKEPQFIKDLKIEGVEILKDVSKNQTWKIYTKKYTEREQAQRDGGEGLHPGYDLISFFNTFKDRLPPLKQSDQLITFLTAEEKKALGLVNPNPKSESNTNTFVLNDTIIVRGIKTLLSDYSQYSQRFEGLGTSACTLNATNFLDNIIGKQNYEYNKNKINTTLINAIKAYKDATAEKKLSINHLGIEQCIGKDRISNIGEHLITEKQMQGDKANEELIIKYFKDVATKVKTTGENRGVVLISSGVTVSVAIILSNGRLQFLLFDSHSHNEKELPQASVMEFSEAEKLVKEYLERYPSNPELGFHFNAYDLYQVKRVSNN